MDKGRRKITISVGLSPWIIEKLDKVLEEGAFTGQSDLISVALAEHFFKTDLELIDQSIPLFLASFLSNKNSRQQLLDIIPENAYFRISALKKKAKACIELGELDEAQECLNEAKKLEDEESK